VQDCAVAHADALLDLEINPLVATPTRAVALDALVRLGEKP
jgi:succinyl-CoA synthetase beta subunit